MSNHTPFDTEGNPQVFRRPRTTISEPMFREAVFNSAEAVLDLSRITKLTADDVRFAVRQAAEIARFRQARAQG